MTGPLPKGHILNEKYMVEGLAGEGATGFVYIATEVSHPDRRWAIKEIWLSSSPGPEGMEQRELFRRECEILKGLEHPGLPGVIDEFIEGSRQYVVMEHIRGENLHRILKERETPMTFQEVFPILQQLTGILEYLHSRRPPVIFRDLKPSNIMLTEDGRVKLIDFGIARLFSPEKTRDTFVMGTPGFSAPEQYGIGQSDPRTDIYALGVTIFHLLTKEDPERFAFKFPPLAETCKDVPLWFSEIIDRSLSQNPGQRYDSVMEMRKALEEKESAATSRASALAGGATYAASTVPAASIIPSTTAAAPEWGIIIWKFGCAAGLSWISSYAQSFPNGNLIGIITSLGALFFAVSLIWDGIRLLKTMQHKWMSQVTIALGVTGLIFLLLPGVTFYRNCSARTPDSSSQCCRNLRELGVACETYAVDNQGQYPPSLKNLVPAYLDKIPQCSAPLGLGYQYIRDTDIAYTVWCGNSHAGHAHGFPQYDSYQALSK